MPGTELLFDSVAHHHKEATGLQFLRRKDGVNIILVPQPSPTDPNDPLSWAPWKKWATYLNGVAYAFMGSVTGPIMAAGMMLLASTFDTTLQKLTYANGATLICQGVGNVFWMCVSSSSVLPLPSPLTHQASRPQVRPPARLPFFEHPYGHRLHLAGNRVDGDVQVLYRGPRVPGLL